LTVNAAEQRRFLLRASRANSVDRSQAIDSRPSMKAYATRPIWIVSRRSTSAGESVIDK
jgi:hypothetical protein